MNRSLPCWVGIPLAELLFGFAFGLYWTGVYEHFTWHRSDAPSRGAAPAAVISSQLTVVNH